MKKIFLSTSTSIELGLCIIRIGIGILFIMHGFPKIIGGASKWLWLGSQMKNLGITFWPVAWGFAAACSEFFGGILLVAGLATRIAAFFMSCVMIVALIYHLSAGDTFMVYSHPLALLIVFIGFIIAGGGTYSLDALISRKQ